MARDSRASVSLDGNQALVSWYSSQAIAGHWLPAEDDDEGIARLRKISLHYHAISRLAMGVPGRLAEAVEGKKLAAACEEAAETLTAGGHHEVEQRWLKLRCAARAVSFMKDEETRFIYRVVEDDDDVRTGTRVPP